MGTPADELTGSEARLWRLIEKRAEPGADVAAIDQRIWDLFGEEWSIMFTDLSGFSRRVAEFGILHFLQVIREHHKLLLPIVEEHDGLLIKTEGDSFLLLFRRPARALECAVRMQAACEQYNQGRRPEQQVLLCIGIGYGRVLRIGDQDVWGREVNLASKLGEDTAKAWEILVTGAVRAAASDVPGCSFTDVGHGFEETERLYRVDYSRALDQLRAR